MASNSSSYTSVGRRSMVLIRPLPLLSMSVDQGSNSTATEPVKDGPAPERRYARVAFARNEIVNVAP